MRLLQVCNVGNIVGGTAACAWSVTQALPDFEHVVWFRSEPTAETRVVFSGAELHSGRQLTAQMWKKISPDLVLLHNTPAEGVFWSQDQIPGQAVVVCYRHSRAANLAAAHQQIVCSECLRQSSPGEQQTTVYQGVPRPPRETDLPQRALSDHLVVGRICTPVLKKWPVEMLNFYRKLAQQFPEIQWEFVGCPPLLQSSLLECLQGKAVFHQAGWGSRQWLHRWHVLLYSQPEITESFGRVCAEAMRSGCVPVVDATGGFCEQVTCGTGFLCANRDEFCQALQQLQEMGCWWQCSQRAREQADERFSHASFRQRLLQIFRQGCL